LINKNLLGHGSGSDRFGPSRVVFQVEHYRIFSGLKSFQVDRVGFRVLMSLNHFGLRVIRVRVGLGFGLYDIGYFSGFGLFRVGSGLVGFFFIMFNFGSGRISGRVGFQIVRF
jgi:hypothetical protein